MTGSKFFVDDGSRRKAACNEPVKDYAPGSSERTEIKTQLAQMLTERIELPLVIGGEHVRTGLLEPAIVPHDHAHVLADAHLAGRKHIEDAIAAAQRAWHAWSRTPWPERAAIFLKAADLLSGSRRKVLNAATMLVERVGARRYRNYPRLVGETGGKNFVLAHASADLDALVVAIMRGGFEYQGQKCSAASRVFVSQSLWKKLKERLVSTMEGVAVGDVTNFANFMGAVIDEKSWRKLSGAVDAVRHTAGVELVAGGDTNMSRGYFVRPTLIKAEDATSRYMTEEFFGPIVTAFVYPDSRFDETLALIDRTSDYGLTGAVFAGDRSVIAHVSDKLRHAAGNFYINDKPTGAVVGQQPFGGARRSGTNDKAGSMWNLIRWVSPRTIKETFAPPIDYQYPSMRAE
jgi:acyl-CoA reductase-like NAD-dependent aldehyde dehydrogenase